MNTAARFNQSILSRDWIVSVLLTRSQITLVALILGVLLSALSVVYVTNTTRSLNANYQQTLTDRNRLHVEWGQLLLEKSTWIMQARVQQIAEDRLRMVTPDSKSTVVINE